MNLRLFALAALPCALLAFACGDGPDTEATPTTAPTRKPGEIPPDFGPTPALGGNILKITPAHAAAVKQATTRTTDGTRPQGLCVEVSFAGLPESGRWFRLVLDATEVTTQLTWRVAPQAGDTSGGTFCFAPPEGLSLGKHTAAVAVQDPNNINARSKQIVSWAFEVIE